MLWIAASHAAVMLHIYIAKRGADEGRHIGMKDHRPRSQGTVILTMSFDWIYSILKTLSFF